MTVCLIAFGEAGVQTARSTLQAKAFDAVVIGAGVRNPPPHLHLFEQIINVVHEHAPKAKICFNTTPEDTAEAIMRWVKP